MAAQRIIRNFVIVASLAIFCYQINVALDNLMSNATVDSTKDIPISDLDSPPVITFCPRQEYDYEILDEWGNWFVDISFFSLRLR